MLRHALLVAALSLFTPAVALDDDMHSVVQDEYDDMIYGSTPPFREILSPTVDDLDDGGRTTYSYTLVRGATYRFFGVCDEDCEDLDLVVYDGQNRRIAADFGMNDRPTVDFTVPRDSRNTRYTLAVVMSSCDAGPCQFAVGHLRR